jgi:CBS domain-containing protein
MKLSNPLDLTQCKIASVIAHRRHTTVCRPLISVHQDTSLVSVLLLLKEEGILSVPVYEQALDSGKRFIGIVSLYDILSYTVFQRFFDDLEKEQMKGMDFKSQLEVLEKENVYFSTTVKTLIGQTSESLTSWFLKSSDSVSRLIALMTEAGYHRILVLDEEAE